MCKCCSQTNIKSKCLIHFSSHGAQHTVRLAIAAPVLRSIMNLLHMGSAFRITEKIFSVPVIWIGENISFEIHVKLIPKSCSIIFRDCFTDGNWVFILLPPQKQGTNRPLLTRFFLPQSVRRTVFQPAEESHRFRQKNGRSISTQ